MKKILFTSTALAALAFGGVASAQGISLFGDARLGLGYNIGNNGDLLLEAQSDDDGNFTGFDTPDDLRAVSRVRFGVNMTGVTDSGITFGATIRADNSGGGQGGFNGQSAGNVFVSGDWGTLTYGDTDGADAFFIGDLNEVGLTCLTCQNETPWISNGGGYGDDDGRFFNNASARPTVRYNIDVAGFGLALSTNRDLTDVGVGLGYDGEFGNSTFSIGLGYYDFSDFDTVNVIEDANDDLIVVTEEFPGGKQWSGGLGFGTDMFDAKIIYTRIDFDDADDFEGGEHDWAGIGLGFEVAEFGVDAYYAQIVKSNVDELDGLQTYGLGVTYDLGGGARVEGGIASVMSLLEADDGYIVADFGIGMSF